MDKNSLNVLSDKELLIIAQNIDLNVLLQPIKRNNRHYSQFIPMLGRLDKKSILVKKNLPGIAVKLYQKRDQNFVKLLDEGKRKFTDSFIDTIQSILEKKISVQELSCFSVDQYVDILKKYMDKCSNNEIDFELLWVQLKLAGIDLDVEKKRDILIGWQQIQYSSSEDGKPKESDKEGNIIKEKQDLDNNIAEEQDKKGSVVNLKEPLTQKKKNIIIVSTPQSDKNSIKKNLTIYEKEYIKEKANQTITSGVNDEHENLSIMNDDIEERKMGIYVGKINIKSNYYNFMPIGEIVNECYNALTEMEISRLLPDSQFQNINLFYNFYDETQVKFMKDHFYENQIVLFEFDVEDLAENTDVNGNRNPTGYKISGVESVRSKKIRFMSDDGFFVLKAENVLLDDIRTHKIVKIKDENIVEGERILIDLQDGFYAGPYEVKYSSTNLHFYIKPLSQENKFILIGYKKDDCILERIDSTIGISRVNQSWYYYRIKPGAEPIVRDVISDEKLLESFQDSLNKSRNNDIKLDNINDILEKYRESVVAGEIVTEEIRNQRIERLENLLTSEATLDVTTMQISDFVCDLLIKTKDTDKTEKVISMMLEKRPDFADKIQSMRIIKERVDNAKQELELLKLQKEEVKEAVKNIENDTEDKIVRQEIKDKLDAEILEKKEELQRINEKLELTDVIEDLNAKVKELKSDVTYYESHKSHLQNDTKDLEGKFIDLVNRNSEKIVDITFDGFMSSKMLQAAAEWDTSKEKNDYRKLVTKINNITACDFEPEELIDYLVNVIHIVRPGYDRNTIVNLLTCSMQGFLTVLSGAPGCGKTSICNIISKVLGLTKLNGMVDEGEKIREANRYIMVSVERGWTSKRDFIGYYNPLTKAFEENNLEVFDGLRLLNIEAQMGIKRFPYIILLDEANLSPMEYYWADFMNVCDDLQDNNIVNLGNNNLFEIPETLHFWATINNDHTTETLSPRLIDRAWIITLPKVGRLQYGIDIPEDYIRNVSWESLKKAFITPLTENLNFDIEIQKIYDGMYDILNKEGLQISPRMDIAIHKYWNTASKLMEEDEYGNSPSIIALDYAVSQKVLPKIGGSGEEYGVWLEQLKQYCVDTNLLRSTEIIQNIIEHGKRQMNYFQFFY